MYFVILFNTVVLFLIGIYGLYVLRTDGWRHLVGAWGVAVICIMNFFALISVTGFPKPIEIFFSDKEFTVIAIAYEEDKAIYLWGYIEGKSEPVALRLPWKEEEAKRMRQAETKEEQMILKKSGIEIELYPSGLVPLPPKQVE